MKTSPSPLNSAGLALVAALAAVPATTRAQGLDDLDQSIWSLRLGGVARFNVKSTLTAIPRILDTGVYDDGYVLEDAGGPESGLTWNWGYNDTSQISGDNMELNRLDGLPNIGAQDVSGSEPKPGGELIAGCRIGRFSIGRYPAAIGLELGYGYSPYSQSLDFSASGTVTRTSDTYSLGGIHPPPAPYGGTASTPGPLIDLAYANRSVVSSAAATTLQGDLDVSFHDFRFGPALSLQMAKRLDVALGVGYSSVYPAVKLRYVQTTTFSNPAVPGLDPSTVDVSEGQWCPGFYAELRLDYRITRHWGAFLGGGYQYNSSFDFDTPDHTLDIDMGSTYTAKAGVIYQF
jgi:hypothetical protein